MWRCSISEWHKQGCVLYLNISLLTVVSSDPCWKYGLYDVNDVSLHDPLSLSLSMLHIILIIHTYVCIWSYLVYCCFVYLSVVGVYDFRISYRALLQICYTMIVIMWSIIMKKNTIFIHSLLYGECKKCSI